MTTTGLTGHADATAADRHIQLVNGVGRVTLAANLSLTARYGNVLRLDPGGASRNVDLPAEDQSNGLWYLIENTADAAENLVLRDDTPATVITLARQEIALVACDGTAWVAVPLTSPSNAIAAVLDPAADSLVFIDATDNGEKLESIADLVDAITGNGLADTAGVIAVEPDATTGGTVIPVDVSADGVGVDVADIAPAVADADIAVATDEFLFRDADDGTTTKRESVADLANAQAGDGLTATAGVYSVTHPIYVASGTIAAAAVATLNATPVEVIVAPAAGYYVEVLDVHWFLDFETVGYDAAAAGDALVLKYTDAAGDEVVTQVPGDTIGAALADYHTIVQAVQGPLIPVDGAAIVAHILVGEWYAAAGDSPLKYSISYRVRPFAL